MSKTAISQPKSPAARTEQNHSRTRKSAKTAATVEATKGASQGSPGRRGKNAVPPPQRETKLSSLISMLREKRGASLNRLMKATGWQKHSVRGAISGAVKKKLGLKVVSEKTDDSRIYRIVG